MKVAFFKDRIFYADYGNFCTIETRLEPTGRWKLHTYEDRRKNAMFVEHKAGFFKKVWVKESDIFFKDIPVEEVFDCKGDSNRED